MRRNEMLELMYNTINNYEDIANEYHISRAALDNLLKTMEEAGIYPPSCGYVPNTPVTIKGNILINREKHFNSLVWEPEYDEIIQSKNQNG